MAPDRVFLDVGAHTGQTLDEVTKAHYRFDRIYAFEPMPTQYAALYARYGHTRHVHLYNHGLADRNGTVNVYGDNLNMGTSIYPSKHDVDETIVTEVHMVNASDWFADHLVNGDIVIAKLNCEGAEIPIILDLCSTGAIHRVTSLLVDFDIRKVPGSEHLEEQVLQALARAEFDRFVLAEEVMTGATHQERIAAWLQHPGQLP